MLSSRRGQSSGEVRKIKRYAAPGLGKRFYMYRGGRAHSFVTAGYGHVRLTYRIDPERYMELLPEAKVRGYLFQQQNYIPKDS